MTTIIDGSAGVTYPNSTIQASAGVVLQVIQGSTSTQVSNSTNTFTDTGLTATITPKFANSKILVLITHNGCYKTAGNVDSGVNIRLYRNSTQIGGGYVVYLTGYSNSSVGSITSASINYLDSPATTSSTVYKTTFANNANAAAAYVQVDNQPSFITLMEIAG